MVITNAKQQVEVAGLIKQIATNRQKLAIGLVHLVVVLLPRMPAQVQKDLKELEKITFIHSMVVLEVLRPIVYFYQK